MAQSEVQHSRSPGFFVSRWRRQVPLGLLFWRDMVVVGTAVNFAAAFGGLLALGFKADLALAMLIIHAPLPYNIFLAGAVWRTADFAEPAQSSSARLGAALWLLLTLFV